MFNWYREFVTSETYLKSKTNESVKVTDSDCIISERQKTDGQKEYVLSADLINVLQKSKQEKAYETAADIRKFEIGLFWQRAAYFWAFITVIYGAYFKVFADVCGRQHGKIPLLVLSALGLFFSFSWYLSSRASKHWQENWELHLDLLEDDITGPLYKTYLAKKTYSVSKINIVAGVIVSFCAFCLLVYEFAIFGKTYLHFSGLVGVGGCFLFAVFVLLGLGVYVYFVQGNSEAVGRAAFQEKVYE